jgi:hypothetical protein
MTVDGLPVGPGDLTHLEKEFLASARGTAEAVASLIRVPHPAKPLMKGGLRVFKT